MRDFAACNEALLPVSKFAARELIISLKRIALDEVYAYRPVPMMP
jgi:hypothetical protein